MTVSVIIPAYNEAARIGPVVREAGRHADEVLVVDDGSDDGTGKVAGKEGGRVLRALGYRKRQPFEFNLFYWMPEFMTRKAVKGLLQSRFAEVAFATHAKSARDEMADLAREFRELTVKTSVDTPNIDALRSFMA